jgi:hypothetical protein
MSREHDSRSRGRQPGGAGEAGGAQTDPRMLQVQQLVQAARAFNRHHQDKAAEFTNLTGIDPANFRAVRAWQLAHGQRGDGKIGPATLKAAHAEKGAGDEQPENAGSESATSASAQSATPKDAAGAEHGHGHANQGGHGPTAEKIAFGEDEGSTVEGDNDTSVGGAVLRLPC